MLFCGCVGFDMVWTGWVLTFFVLGFDGLVL